MRTTVDLPEPVLKNAKRLAGERNVTLSEVITDALVAELNAKKSKAVRPFRLITSGGGPNGGFVRTDMDWSKISTIAAELEAEDFLELNERTAREKKS